MSAGTITLLVLPYAGGSAAVFRGWERRLPDWVRLKPVDLPGRGKRRHEPLRTEWPELVASVLAEIESDIRAPFAIFGHSFGALLGYQLAQAARARLGRQPVWLGLSASIAPTHRRRDAHWLTCPAAEVLSELKELKGTPAELLEHAELMELLLPVLRADFHLCGTFPEMRPMPLTCPMTVFGGLDDPISTPRENLGGWAAETTGVVDLQMLPGDHFFIDRDANLLVSRISTALATVGRGEIANAS